MNSTELSGGFSGRVREIRHKQVRHDKLIKLNHVSKRICQCLLAFSFYLEMYTHIPVYIHVHAGVHAYVMWRLGSTWGAFLGIQRTGSMWGCFSYGVEAGIDVGCFPHDVEARVKVGCFSQLLLSLFLKTHLSFNCMFLSVGVYVTVCVGALRGQRRASDFLEVELQVVMSTW